MALGSDFYLGTGSSLSFWMSIRIAMEFKTCLHDMIIPIAVGTLADSFLRKLFNNKGSPHSRLTIKYSRLAVCLGTNNCINGLNIWKGSGSKDTTTYNIQMCIQASQKNINSLRINHVVIFLNIFWTFHGTIRDSIIL
ncbi:hypothetical protein V8G54_008511 [Vigna mungo]|uniref:Uncharacterized protein n=1 Tax=Vigna mungo TaxID=3915 RepID=A0AAQ3S6J0_VIGMU